MVTQVLKENLRHIEKRHANAASSLKKCNKRQIQIRSELITTSEALQVVVDDASGRELEHRISSLQTSLTAIEWGIAQYENIIEDCRMQEEEACQEEEPSHEWEEEEAIDAEMVEEEEHGDAEPSGPQGMADTEGALLWIPLVMLSPLRRMPSSCSRHPNLKIPPLDLTAPGVRPVRSWERWPI